jgi:hypothetical protein
MKWRVAGILLGVLLVGMALLPRVSSAEFFGVPKSDRVVAVEISFPQDNMPHPINVTVRDGTMLTIINEETGRTDAWAPAIGPDGSPVFRHFQVFTDARGDHPKQEGKAERIPDSESQDFLAGWTYRLTNKGITLGSFPNLPAPKTGELSPGRLSKIYGKTGGGMCCVSCGGLTVCAASVDMDCGYCSYPGSGGRPAI